MYNVEVPPKTIRENSIPLSVDYDVLITIVNPEPNKLKVQLDGRDLNINLQPFLKTITPVANFTVKSQWIYLVDLGVTPKKFGEHYALLEEQLPHIITPLEKKTWSHMSSRPCLNLVVYISHCDKPLYIYDVDKKMVESNSFLSPRWGGVQILNAGEENCKTGVYNPELKPIISIFLTQLKQLVGLPNDSQSSIYHLKKTKAKEMIDSTRRTLKSLAQLLSEISSIVISDEVADKVVVALKHANEAEEYLSKGDVTNSLRCAKIAYQHSEKAFSDPSLLALLYFPDDQKYAVYIPLFLPIMIPVLMSLTTLRRCYLNKMKLKTE